MKKIEKSRAATLTRPPVQSQRGYDKDTALRALCGMGFKDAEARRALAMVEQRWAGLPPPIETILREALSELA